MADDFQYRGALGQLKMNAEETDHRGGDSEPALIEWKAFPVLFSLKLFILHASTFFIQDVFYGSKVSKQGSKR
jgi:hypothetical protein